MADDAPKESGGGGSHLNDAIAFVVIAFLVSGFLGYFNIESTDTETGESTEKSSGIFQFSEDRTFDNNLTDETGSVTYGTFEFEGYEGNKEPIVDSIKKQAQDAPLIGDAVAQIGKTVINTKDVIVRIKPAGARIGQQLKRVTGVIAEGPVELFGKEWLRINYEVAPDGWVESEDVTTNVGRYRLFNIFPIIFSFIQPILIVVTLLLFALILWLKMRTKLIAKKIAKQKQLKAEEAGVGAPLPPIISRLKAQAAGGDKAPETDISNDVASTTDSEQKNTVTAPEPDGPIAGAPGNLPTGGSMPNFGGRYDVETDETKDKSGSPVPAPAPVSTTVKPSIPSIKNERWAEVERLMSSNNGSDWRQAIMEADILLGDMLDAMQYPGTTIGEKLKKVEPSDFVTIKKAWEAHRVRNKVAHAGSGFEMRKDEAERVIKLYRQVFSEFYFI